MLVCEHLPHLWLDSVKVFGHVGPSAFESVALVVQGSFCNHNVDDSALSTSYIDYNNLRLAWRRDQQRLRRRNVSISAHNPRLIQSSVCQGHLTPHGSSSPASRSVDISGVLAAVSNPQIFDFMY